MPLCAAGAGPFGNTGKHRPDPDPDRAERRLNPHARQGVFKDPFPQIKTSSLEKERRFLIAIVSG